MFLTNIIAWIAKMLEDAQGIPDEARVGAMLIIFTFCGNSVYSVVASSTHAFDPQTFGIGAGALTVGLGGWLGLRKAN